MRERLSQLTSIVIDQGIRRPINFALDERFYAAALVLTYSGMDTMAFLDMPREKTYVMRSDFIAWVEQYVKVADVTARDLYAARCSVLHGGALSRLSTGGECTIIRHVPPQSNADIASGSAFVSVSHLKDAFFRGVELFMLHIFEREAKRAVVEDRLTGLLQTLPYIRS